MLHFEDTRSTATSDMSFVFALTIPNPACCSSELKTNVTGGVKMPLTVRSDGKEKEESGWRKLRESKRPKEGGRERKKGETGGKK